MFVFRQSPTYLSAGFFVMGLGYLFVYAMFAALGAKVKVRAHNGEVVIRRWYLDALFWLTVTGYVVWFGYLLVEPHIFIQVLQGDLVNARGVLTRRPGITSLTQVGIAFTIFYFNQRGRAQGCRRHQWYQVTILFLAAFRVIAWSEREAVIELLVPIILFSIRNHRTRKFGRLILYLPYWGICLVYVLFAATEYFRSWRYYSQFYHNYFLYIGERLMSYYYTSMNNGAGVLGIYPWPTWTMQNIFASIYSLPGIGNLLGKNYGINDYIIQFLMNYGNPEFNNWSGIFPVFQDVGPLAFCVSGLLGFLSGVSYKAYTASRGFASVIFPILYMTNLEMLRFVYISHPRAVPAILFISVGYLFFRKRDGIRDQATLVGNTLTSPTGFGRFVGVRQLRDETDLMATKAGRPPSMTAAEPRIRCLSTVPGHADGRSLQ